MTKPDKTPVITPVITPPENVSNTELLNLVKSMGEQMATMQSELQSQKERSEQPISKLVKTDEERKPGEIDLATYEGNPIVDMRLVPKMGTDSNGQSIINGMKAVCKVHGKKEDIEMSYGDVQNPTDYANLPRVTYFFTDVSEYNDKGETTWASCIEKNQLISSAGTVAEKVLRGNDLVPTGRLVPVETRRDIRYFTILVNGEKVELAENKLYR